MSTMVAAQAHDDVRLGLGVVAGVGTLTLCAVPIFWAGLFALASFSGCFLECGEPDHSVGLAWAAGAAGLLAIPFAVGLSVARIRSVWWVSPVLSVGIVASMLSVLGR